MANRRTWVLPALTAVFATLVILLAVLQYRWMGEISRAESERLRQTLAVASQRFAEDFDLEVGRLFDAFRLDRPPDVSRAIRQRRRVWQSSSSNPAILADVFLLAKPPDAAPWSASIEDEWTPQLFRTDPSSGELTPTEWPPDMASIAAAVRPMQDRGFEPGRLGGPIELVEPHLPALVIPISPGPPPPNLRENRGKRAPPAG